MCCAPRRRLLVGLLRERAKAGPAAHVTGGAPGRSGAEGSGGGLLRLPLSWALVVLHFITSFLLSLFFAFTQ